MANDCGAAVESLASLVTEKTMEFLIVTYLFAAMIIAAYVGRLAIASRRTSRRLHELRSADTGDAHVVRLKHIA